jgi:hypothetical protein
MIIIQYSIVREAGRPTLNELRETMRAEKARRQPVDLGPALLKCVVGYLGTIEMSVESGLSRFVSRVLSPSTLTLGTPGSLCATSVVEP